MSIQKSKAKLEEAIQEYIDAFSKKQDMDFDGWVADINGSIAQFGDYCFNFEDIRLDLEQKTKKWRILEWHDEQLDKHLAGEDWINYYSWLKLNK